MTVIPLKAYRVAPRKPWVAVDGGVVTFRLPGWFGSRTFSTPVANVGVADLDLVEESPVLEDAFYEEPVVVPYAYTTGQYTVPNVAVVFAEPVALPPFRFLVRQMASDLAPKRAARDGRPAGRYVDGLLLRAADPRAAVETLAAAGVERVVAPEAWLDARRTRVTDPGTVASMDAKDRRFTLVDRATWALTVAGAGVHVAGRVWLGEGVEVAGVAIAVAALGVNQVNARRSERAWFRPRRPDAPVTPPGGGPPRPPGDARDG